MLCQVLEDEKVSNRQRKKRHSNRLEERYQSVRGQGVLECRGLGMELERRIVQTPKDLGVPVKESRKLGNTEGLGEHWFH